MLVRLLASLHDDDGNVAVAGLHESTAAAVDYPAGRVREESGLLDGVREIGSGSVPQRMWAKPAITVIGIDTTSDCGVVEYADPTRPGQSQYAGRTRRRRRARTWTR